MSKIFFFGLILLLVSFSGCSTKGKKTYKKYNYSSKSVSSSEIEEKKYPHPTMKPYEIAGIRYYPEVVSVGDEFTGNASWYGPTFHGKHTSNGEIYDMYDMTAAHKTLPMNTVVRVTNTLNDKTVVVRINDRGPFVDTRIIDLSKTAAKKIGVFGPGTAPVIVEILETGTYYGKIQAKKTTEDVIVAKADIPEVETPKKEEYSGSFALQIASFSQIEGAINAQEKHDNTDGYRTIIKDIEHNGDRIFKVWLKGFASEDEARLYKLNSSFENAFIVREETN